MSLNIQSNFLVEKSSLSFRATNKKGGKHCKLHNKPQKDVVIYGDGLPIRCALCNQHMKHIRIHLPPLMILNLKDMCRKCTHWKKPIPIVR